MQMMTNQQRQECHRIIHTAAAGSGAANLLPVPGVGVAADLFVMQVMAMSLVAVFGGNITEQTAKGMAFLAIKKMVFKQPIKVVGKEFSKLLPLLGLLASASISAALIEAAGWSLATELALNSNASPIRSTIE
jgi:uncharacterized protein (DUF697 family)